MWAILLRALPWMAGLAGLGAAAYARQHSKAQVSAAEASQRQLEATAAGASAAAAEESVKSSEDRKTIENSNAAKSNDEVQNELKDKWTNN